MSKFFSFQKRIGSFCFCHIHAQCNHPLAKFFTVFCFVNCFYIYTYQPYVILLPQSQVFGFFGKVQRCLSAHCGQHCIYLIARCFTFLKYLFNTFYGERQQIDFISHHGVGHDSCRIAVDKCNTNSFFPQTACSLCTGVVKFAGLSNDNRTRADNQN